MASLGACLLVTAARADNVAAARDARALARARTELLATIHRLPLAPGLSVAGWAAQEAELDRDLRRWVRAREPYGGERVYSDGACDIDVRVTPELLVWRIREWQTRDASRLHDVLTDEQLETARDSWPILWGGGIAAGSEQPGAECPPGWEDVSQAGIAATREAATVQALGQLLDEIGAVRLAGAWEVRAFYTSDEVLAQAFIDAVRERSATEVSFAGDQVAVARLGLSRATLVRLLTELHDLYYLEGQFSRADIRELVLQPGVSEFVAAAAAPPPDSLRLPIDPEAVALPGEIDPVDLTATAVWRPRPYESYPLPIRIEFARYAALDVLRARLMTLSLTEAVTVGRRCEADELLRDDVERLLRGARVAGRVRDEPDGTTEVRVELRPDLTTRILNAARARLTDNGRRALRRAAGP